MIFRLFSFFVFVVIAAGSAHAGSLTDGVAITEASKLRPLEQKYGIGYFIPVASKIPLIGNDELSLTPQFAPIVATIDSDIQEYRKANPNAGVGVQYGERLFDMRFLKSSLARFVLVGIVNRMDRAFVSPETCGEIRFIYRLAYNVTDDGMGVASRLPMTVNLVLNAKTKDDSRSCSEIAKRWITVNEESSVEQIQDVLAGVGPEQIKQLEINLQLVRSPAGVRPDFGGHAEYLLRVFAYKKDAKIFVPTTLENQVDHDRLLADQNLRSKFKEWLRQPEIKKALDKGTALIPTEFLATKAISVAPGGMSRSRNRPLYAVVTTNELKEFDFTGNTQVKSALGMYRRLNDMSCIGCHQTRAIGGFHFMGKDPSDKYPGNSVFVPGSAHFFADLPRRKDIIQAFVDGRTPDYSRGFTDRPQEYRSQNLKGSGLLNGWGAHCSNSNDPSLSTMTCAKGLRCRVLLKTNVEPDSGICVPDGRQEVGDPLQEGVVEIFSYGDERYTMLAKDELPSPQDKFVASPQGSHGSAGGFSAGMIRTKTCENLPPEAVCAALPAAREGFNDCLDQKNFLACIHEFSVGVGLRGCDEMNPCRDDYICSMSYESKRGACVPPYFLFQFRVDGHPISKAKN
jgi:hypothetical protein